MTWAEARREAGRIYWTRLLVDCKGNICEMARQAGVTRTQVYKVLARFHIAVPPKNPEWRGGPVGPARDVSAFV